MIQRQLEHANSSFSFLIPNIKTLVAPIMDTAFQLQHKIGDLNFATNKVSDIGFWQSQLCINARTEILHTEDDYCYTVISVPEQVRELGSDLRYFLLQLNPKFNIEITLKNNTSLFFQGNVYLINKLDHWYKARFFQCRIIRKQMIVQSSTKTIQ